MNKKFIGILLVLLLFFAVFLGLVLSYEINEKSMSKKTFTVYTEGPIALSDMINSIRTYSYYDGYDNETLEWMESLGSKSVFTYSNSIFIMSPYDANKLDSVYVTDGFMTEDFSCNVKEKHILLDNENRTYVYYVDDVKFISEKFHSFGLA